MESIRWPTVHLEVALVAMLFRSPHQGVYTDESLVSASNPEHALTCR